MDARIFDAIRARVMLGCHRETRMPKGTRHRLARGPFLYRKRRIQAAQAMGADPRDSCGIAGFPNLAPPVLNLAPFAIQTRLMASTPDLTSHLAKHLAISRTQ